jgi:hypothetical protein
VSTLQLDQDKKPCSVTTVYDGSIVKMKLLVEPILKKIQVIWLDKLAGNICKNQKSAWLSL